jgi:hypothetical protein
MMELIWENIVPEAIMEKEPIRDALPAHTSIDRVRRDPVRYLELQESQWIQRKQTILNALMEREGVTLIDRSPADVLFYVLAYMIPEPWWLDPEEVSDYRERRSALVSDIYSFYEEVIDGNPDIICMFFNQIDPSENTDPMRPKAIRETQDMEQWGIRALSDAFFMRCGGYHIITATSDTSRNECFDAVRNFTEDQE